jgi:hypothetical protein
MRFEMAAPVFTIGSLIAIVVLILSVIFFVIGVPDPKTLLVLIGGLALARLL